MVDQKILQKVTDLRTQGYQNSQIIDALQKDGHNSSQIFDALNQSAIGNAGPQSAGLPPAPSFDEDLAAPAPPSQPELPRQPPQGLPSFTPPQQDNFARQPPQRAPASSRSDVSTEEYIEAIIDEKWVELEADVEKIVEWKNRSEQRLTQLSQQVTDLKDRFEKLHAALIGKIETYDKNILEVGAEIKAMEKVFSKVLPVFTDNVKQLSDVTEKISRRVQ